MASKGIVRGGKLPQRFIPVGGELERCGRVFVCVERHSVALPKDACFGCWFAKTHRDKLISNCSALQCSRFDRKDGRDVWFVEKEAR